MTKTLDLNLLPRFLRFGLVGCAGYVVDVAVLYAATGWFHLGPYSGRLISYLCAATTTWRLNASFTFMDMRSSGYVKEWAKFICVNTVGGVANYGAYAFFIHQVSSAPIFQAVGVAIGSLSGMGINYFLSRKFVFVGRYLQHRPS
jgi:putative flippase GtrA